MKRLFLFTLLTAVLSCKAKIQLEKYSHEESGWSCEYPSDWKKLTKQETKHIEEKGKRAIEETIGTEVGMYYQNLLDLKKDPFNSFISTAQAFDEKTDGPYAETEAAVNEILLQTFRDQKVKFSYEFGTEKIDGLKFSTLQINLYGKDGKLIMTQIVYDRLIDNKISLTLAISYNSEKNKETLLNIVHSSKLLKRN